MKSVRVLPVDTLAAPHGSGTFGSRGAVSMAGSAAAAADRLREKLQALAGHLLEASPADVAIEEGRASVRGFPDRAVTLAEVARLAYWLPRGGLPGGLEPGLETPSPLMPGGLKGMGEGGTIGAPAAIANAVADAVRGLGVRVTQLPIRPEIIINFIGNRPRTSYST